MEQNKHDPNQPDDHAHLFAQMDEILADAHAQEMEATVAQSEQYGRQSHFLGELRPIMDANVLPALDVLFDTSDDKQHMAADVMASLMNDYADEELDADGRKGIEYLYNIADLVHVVTDGQTVEGEFTTSHKKSEVQLSVLDNDMFTYKQKHKIIALIDDAMPGESLDIYDPAAVTEALTRRHAILNDDEPHD